MREILFRGKRVGNGEWAEGFYACVLDSHYIITGRFDSLTNGIINSEAYKVDLETVGRFTGLTDTNGRKIFEGDILRVTDEHKEYITFVRCVDNTLCVDIFVDNTGVLELDYDYTAIGFAEDFWKNQSCKVEIIGNVHDNPELLEVGE